MTPASAQFIQLLLLAVLLWTPAPGVPLVDGTNVFTATVWDGVRYVMVAAATCWA